MIKQKGIIVLILLVIVLLVAYVFYTRNGNKSLTENFNTDVQFQNKSAHFTSGFSKLKIPNQELNTSNGITICFWAKDLNNGIKRQKDKIVLNEIDYIYDKVIDMKRMLKNKKYNESVNEKTVSIGGEDLMKYLMKRFKMSKSQAIASMKKHKMDMSFLKKESVNEGKGVEKILKMADEKSFGKIAGRTVDGMTAGLFKAVYDKAPQNAKDKIDKMNEKQLYVFMGKLWNKFGRQVKLS